MKTDRDQLLDTFTPSLTKDFRLQCEDVIQVRIWRGVRQYLIKWRGLPDRFSSWQSPERLGECRRQVEEFNRLKRFEIQWMERQYNSVNPKIKSRYPLRRFELPEVDDPYTRTLKKAAEGIVVGQNTPQTPGTLQKRKQMSEVSFQTPKKVKKDEEKQETEEKNVAVLSPSKKINKKRGRPPLKPVKKNQKEQKKLKRVFSERQQNSGSDNLSLFEAEVSNALQYLIQTEKNNQLMNLAPPAPRGFSEVNFEVQVSEIQYDEELPLKIKSNIDQIQQKEKQKVSDRNGSNQFQSFDDEKVDDKSIKVSGEIDHLKLFFQGKHSIYHPIQRSQDQYSSCRQRKEENGQDYSQNSHSSIRSPFDSNGCYKAVEVPKKKLNLGGNQSRKQSLDHIEKGEGAQLFCEGSQPIVNESPFSSNINNYYDTNEDRINEHGLFNKEDIANQEIQSEWVYSQEMEEKSIKQHKQINLKLQEQYSNSYAGYKSRYIQKRQLHGSSISDKVVDLDSQGEDFGVKQQQQLKEPFDQKQIDEKSNIQHESQGRQQIINKPIPGHQDQVMPVEEGRWKQYVVNLQNQPNQHNSSNDIKGLPMDPPVSPLHQPVLDSHPLQSLNYNPLDQLALQAERKQSLSLPSHIGNQPQAGIVVNGLQKLKDPLPQVVNDDKHQISDHLSVRSSSDSEVVISEEKNSDVGNNKPQKINTNLGEEREEEIEEIPQKDYLKSFNQLNEQFFNKTKLISKQQQVKYEHAVQRLKVFQKSKKRQETSRSSAFVYQPTAMGETYKQVRRHIDEDTLTWTAMSKGQVPRLVKVLDLVTVDQVRYVYGLFWEQREQLFERFVMIPHFLHFYPGELQKYGMSREGVEEIRIVIGVLE